MIKGALPMVSIKCVGTLKLCFPKLDCFVTKHGFVNPFFCQQLQCWSCIVDVASVECVSTQLCRSSLTANPLARCRLNMPMTCLPSSSSIDFGLHPANLPLHSAQWQCTVSKQWWFVIPYRIFGRFTQSKPLAVVTSTHTLLLQPGHVRTKEGIVKCGTQKLSLLHKKNRLAMNDQLWQQDWCLLSLLVWLSTIETSYRQMGNVGSCLVDKHALCDAMRHSWLLFGADFHNSMVLNILMNLLIHVEQYFVYKKWGPMQANLLANCARSKSQNVGTNDDMSNFKGALLIDHQWFDCSCQGESSTLPNSLIWLTATVEIVCNSHRVI